MLQKNMAKANGIEKEGINAVSSLVLTPFQLMLLS